MKKFKPNIEVLILVGGRGTRLKSISKNTPKPLVKINNLPFLLILLEYLYSYNFINIVLCTGYKAYHFKQFLEQEEIAHKIKISNEKKPMGTAGAIQNAKKHIQSRSFLVINGDSFCDLDYSKFCQSFESNNPILQIAVLRSDNVKGYGAIKLDGMNRIVDYKEKQDDVKDSSVYISVGIYQFSSEVIKYITPNEFVSLEYDIIPKLIHLYPDRVYGYEVEGKFIDIGTPKNYYKSKIFLN